MQEHRTEEHRTEERSNTLVGAEQQKVIEPEQVIEQLLLGSRLVARRRGQRVLRRLAPQDPTRGDTVRRASGPNATCAEAALLRHFGGWRRSQ